MSSARVSPKGGLCCPSVPRSLPFRPISLSKAKIQRVSTEASLRQIACSSETEQKASDDQVTDLENTESDLSRKKEEADRLRAAEKFMKVGTGEAFCKGCGYEYKPSKGDPEYPVSAGTYYKDLPEDWLCPICGAEKQSFESQAKEIAGFAENQGYGFGTNSMTSGQKSILIYGSLLAFFILFCAGYLLQ